MGLEHANGSGSDTDSEEASTPDPSIYLGLQAQLSKIEQDLAALRNHVELIASKSGGVGSSRELQSQFQSVVTQILGLEERIQARIAETEHWAQERFEATEARVEAWGSELGTQLNNHRAEAS